ncbi:ATP-dependent nuclease [Marinithermus hydrothermalis]|uniref:SMC domain protein n=1 Tax=Marinithermus hydrothermalis (strain DSM 14884 / JCM 11576 / T1) TaxID=869210 RepID=F2NP60_MARHT|nr:AAA family ATPase [Marinithermus hydrothermalis]AEB11861.1 SMC domain protein [Marinithermus hydrothermalis DSM 14884]
MARIRKLTIEGYRSIRDPIEIIFPQDQPVVLMGENNAGKSNIVRALQLVLGPSWPGNHEPEDYEFFGRERNRAIRIEIEFNPDDPLGGRFSRLVWCYDPSSEEPIYFRGFKPYGEERYIKTEDRDTCIAMVVEAERSLHYHLSYSSKWTLLSRLMHRFHRALSGHDQVRNDLENLFGQIKGKFHEVPEFKDFVENLQDEFGDLIANMPHRLQVDFEAYNPVNFFHALRLHAAEGDEPRTLEEMGTGEQQVLALAFAYAYARAFHGGILLVVEEPEAHLHPLAQRWLARRLRSRCQQGLQVLLTTHSPAFVSIEGLEGLVLVYKEEGSTRVRQLSRADLVQKCIHMGAPSNRVNEGNILPFYAANATSDILSGFFARVIVLVEGQADELALPILFAKRGFDVEREGVAILGVGGKGNLAKWYRLFSAYGLPCYIVFDNDARDDNSGTKRRDALRAVGITDETEADQLIGLKTCTYAPWGYLCARTT